MVLQQKIGNVMRGLKQKWGSAELKRRMWDSEYAGGRWDHCENAPDEIFYSYVHRYCMNGSILDLGCGSGNTANEIDADRYTEYTGVDISEVALKKAEARSEANGRGSKNHFFQSDILGYIPSRKHDLILFRQSIYYVPIVKIRSMLERYSDCLTERGVFLANLSGTKDSRVEKVWRIIEDGFRVLEKEFPNGAAWHLVVFH